MKALIMRHKHLHQARTNATSLIIWQDKQVRIINDEITVRNGVAKPDQFGAIPSRDKRMRSQQCLVQQIGLLRRRPLIGAIKSQNALKWQITTLTISNAVGSHRCVMPSNDPKLSHGAKNGKRQIGPMPQPTAHSPLALARC